LLTTVPETGQRHQQAATIQYGMSAFSNSGRNGKTLGVFRHIDKNREWSKSLDCRVKPINDNEINSSSKLEAIPGLKFLRPEAEILLASAKIYRMREDSCSGCLIVSTDIINLLTLVKAHSSR